MNSNPGAHVVQIFEQIEFNRTSDTCTYLIWRAHRLLAVQPRDLGMGKMYRIIFMTIRCIESPLDALGTY